MAKILIIEDEVVLRTTLKDGITKGGFDVVTANDGKEGLEVALKEHPDLILLDILMPVMGGLDMLHELRKDEWGKNAEVIILTNENSSDDLAKAMEEGTFEYFIKADTKIDDLVEKIKEKLA